jgi:hypothetical protein
VPDSGGFKTLGERRAATNHIHVENCTIQHVTHPQVLFWKTDTHATPMAA